MQQISTPIKTCIAGAEILLEAGKFEEAGAVFRCVFKVARSYGSKADFEYSVKALENFTHTQNPSQH